MASFYSANKGISSLSEDKLDWIKKSNAYSYEADLIMQIIDIATKYDGYQKDVFTTITDLRYDNGEKCFKFAFYYKSLEEKRELYIIAVESNCIVVGETIDYGTHNIRSDGKYEKRTTQINGIQYSIDM
ncbi:MAG: hypothetical protein K5697_07205 [Lachnospiraceae bacterium]|nr:hypothetical protein [Lachnospiraceae bacterium]